MNQIQQKAAAEIARMRAETTTPEGVSEEAIAAKMRVGLTRSQAIEVIRNQAAHDAAKAATATEPKQSDGDPKQPSEKEPSPDGDADPQPPVTAAEAPAEEAATPAPKARGKAKM